MVTARPYEAITEVKQCKRTFIRDQKHSKINIDCNTKKIILHTYSKKMNKADNFRTETDCNVKILLR